MMETGGELWLRRHWVLSFVAASGVLLIISALAVPSLLRVRNQAHSIPQPTTVYEDQAVSSTLDRGMPLQATLSPPTAMTYFAPSAISQSKSLPDRKIARTSSMDLLVSHPADQVEKIRAHVDSLGGYFERSEISGSQDNAIASITIAVPSAKLEEVKSELRKLSVSVEREKTDAQDVTKQYVDVQARMRNLRAEESQYLQIMHSATKVQDMLDVSEKISEVRGQIEQAQAEFESLSKQVEMVSISVSLRSQPKAAEFALNWKPMQQLRISLHDALDGVADYATAMSAALLYLPVIVLWLATIILGSAAGWRILRWIARTFFNLPTTLIAERPAQ
jgi:archaellum component FlaC